MTGARTAGFRFVLALFCSSFPLGVNAGQGVHAKVPRSLKTVIKKFAPAFKKLEIPSNFDDEIYNPLVYDYVCAVLEAKKSISKSDFERFDISVDVFKMAFHCDLRFYGADGRNGESLSVKEQNGGVVVVYDHHTWSPEKQDVVSHVIKSRAFQGAKIVP